MFKLKLHHKLIFGFGSMLLIAVLIGVIAIININKIDSTLNELTDTIAPTVETADDLIMILWEANKVAEEIIADEEMSDIKELVKEFESLNVKFIETHKELSTLVTDKDFLDELKNAQTEHTLFTQTTRKMIDAHILELEKEATVTKLMENFETIADNLGILLSKTATENENDLKESNDIDDYDAVEAALKLDILIGDILETAREFLSLEDPAALPGLRKEYENIAKETTSLKQQLLMHTDSPEEKANAQKIVSLIDELISSTIDEDELFDEYYEQLEAEYKADDLTEQLENNADNIAINLDKIVAAADAVSNSADDTASELVSAARYTIIILLVIALLVGSTIVIVITRNITRLVGGDPGFISGLAQEIADGNLDVSFGDTSKATGIFAALKAMVDELKLKILEADKKTEEAEQQSKIAHQAQKEAEEAKIKAEESKFQGQLEAAALLEGIVSTLSSSTNELIVLTQKVAEGADIQSTRTSETASAMTEMNASVIEVAKNASAAAEHADLAKEKADDGASIVTLVMDSTNEVQKQAVEMKKSLAELGNHADGIGKIMSVITDIADQTNLLALNAAIEAARAGEAGRGFAVVADEVRKLAEKTMLATTEVGEAVQTIQQGTRLNIESMDITEQTVHKSAELADKAGKTLQLIVDIVDATSEQVSAIATASEEQASASEQISRTIEDVALISQETASGMQRTQASISDVGEQSDKLTEMIKTLREQ